MWMPSFWPGVSCPEQECSVLSPLDDIFSWALLNPSLGSLWGAISGCPTENPGGLLRLRAAARFGDPGARASGPGRPFAQWRRLPAAWVRAARKTPGLTALKLRGEGKERRGGRGCGAALRVIGGRNPGSGNTAPGHRLKRRVFERPAAGGCTNGLGCR